MSKQIILSISFQMCLIFYVCYCKGLRFIFWQKYIFVSRRLQEQVDNLQVDKKKLRTDADDHKVDSDKYKALQSHSSHQQVLLHQLRNRLEQYE